YVEVALQAPPSPDYIPGREEPEQAPPLPDYIPGPEHTDDEIVAEHQPYAEDTLEEDPVDYPADGGDDGDDEEESSEDDEDDEDEEDDEMDVEADEEEEEEHPAPADSVVLAQQLLTRPHLRRKWSHLRRMSLLLHHPLFLPPPLENIKSLKDNIRV
nr:hypothetical protein [Tanacetum cinerariifolium]